MASTRVILPGQEACGRKSRHRTTCATCAFRKDTTSSSVRKSRSSTLIPVCLPKKVCLAYVFAFFTSFLTSNFSRATRPEVVSSNYSRAIITFASSVIHSHQTHFFASGVVKHADCIYCQHTFLIYAAKNSKQSILKFNKSRHRAENSIRCVQSLVR